MKGFIIKFFLIFFLIGGLILSYFLFVPFSKGDRAGTIIKISERGVLFKTWEGELNLGMVISDDGGGAAVGAQNNIWEFSVKNDPVLIEKIKQANRTGHRVQVVYEEKYFKLSWIGDTKYVVTDLIPSGQ